jgi:hypothetical protein
MLYGPPVALRTKNSTTGLDSTHVSIEGVVPKTNQAPSDSDSESTISVDLVAHFTTSLTGRVGFDKHYENYTTY